MPATHLESKNRSVRSALLWLAKLMIMPTDWTIARITVMMRVIVVSFFLPSSPSLLMRSNAGIPTVNSCTIIEALMYGPIPSANSVPFASALPVMPLMSVRKSFPSIASLNVLLINPGTGI